MDKPVFKLEVFEGPLDLMLHLIKENKLDLFDLDMNVLTTQYHFQTQNQYLRYTDRPCARPVYGEHRGNETD